MPWLYILDENLHIEQILAYYCTGINAPRVEFDSFQIDAIKGRLVNGNTEIQPLKFENGQWVDDTSKSLINIAANGGTVKDL